MQVIYVGYFLLLKCDCILCYIKKIGVMVKKLPFNVKVRGSNIYFCNLSILGSLHGEY